ncbi:hypothetical protein ACLF6K_37950 [Streptomyces xanthophaeus]|uniref:hypothetical protein n=2 Tax=Streptomyces TaxID=1883 RepID=UPI00398FD953
MTGRTRLRWLYRASVGIGMACGMALGLATPASAVGPLLVSVQLDAPEITVTFRDTDPDDESFTLDAIPWGTTDPPRRNIPLSREIPNVNRTAVRTVNAGIKAGVPYCVSVVSHTKDILLEQYPSHYRSNTICVHPTGSAGAPADVSIGGITGEANPPSGTNRNYWVSYSNAGADAKGVVIQVQTSGSLSVRRPPESGTFNGFQCSATGTTGYRCTGGTLAKGAKNQIPVLAAVTRNGPGAIHATITAEGDTNPGNNANTHSVMAVPPAS